MGMLAGRHCVHLLVLLLLRQSRNQRTGGPEACWPLTRAAWAHGSPWGSGGGTYVASQVARGGNMRVPSASIPGLEQHLHGNQLARLVTRHLKL